MLEYKNGITAAPIDKSLSRKNSELLLTTDFSFSDWRAYYQAIGASLEDARRMALETINPVALH